MSRRRQEIIDRALKLFNEKGFHDVSIKQIADSLSISPGNLTYYFTKKTDLLKAIQHQLIQETSIDIMPSGYITLYHFEEFSKVIARYRRNTISTIITYNTYSKLSPKSQRVIVSSRVKDFETQNY